MYMQCTKRLGFGHTQKFCYNTQRCSLCDEVDHDILACEVQESADPKYVNCDKTHQSHRSILQ